MKNILNILTHFFLSLPLIGVHIGANATPPDESAMIEFASCGDYSILNSPVDQNEMKKHCASKDEMDYAAWIAIIKRLDPANEARAAARRGDFRLAALIGGGVPAPGQYRFWEVEGADCKNIDETGIAFWIHMSDVFYSPIHGRLQSHMRKFAAEYNAALVIQQDFPKKMECI